MEVVSNGGGLLILNGDGGQIHWYKHYGWSLKRGGGFWSGFTVCICYTGWCALHMQYYNGTFPLVMDFVVWSREITH